MTRRVPGTRILDRFRDPALAGCPVAVGSAGVVCITPLLSWPVAVATESLSARVTALEKSTHEVNTAGPPESMPDSPAGRCHGRTVGWSAPSLPFLVQVGAWSVVAPGSDRVQPRVVDRDGVSQAAREAACKTGPDADQGLRVALSELSPSMYTSSAASPVAGSSCASDARPSRLANDVRLLISRMRHAFSPCTLSHSAKCRPHLVNTRHDCVDSSEGVLDTGNQRATYSTLIQI